MSTRTARHTNLDTVRGVAVLGILIMNGVAFGLTSSAYFNISSGGMATGLDWALGVFGEVFADQKFMGLFSLLFGASVLLFAERAERKGEAPVRLSLWRNALLLAIGVLHSVLWQGDILIAYALCSPALLLVRQWSGRALLVAGVVTFLLSPLWGWFVQGEIAVDALQAYWHPGEATASAGHSDLSDEVVVFIIIDGLIRALGMMLIGMGLYKTGVVTGQRSDVFYMRLGIVGVSVGTLLAGAGVAWVMSREFSPEVAFVGNVPNGLATIPMTLGYLGALTWLDRQYKGALIRKFRALGQMALTNYLSQTLLGLAILGMMPRDSVTRTTIWAFTLAVWALQLGWSERWLRDHRFGPLEWLWRCATYRRWEPLRVERVSADPPP